MVILKTQQHYPAINVIVLVKHVNLLQQIVPLVMKFFIMINNKINVFVSLPIFIMLLLNYVKVLLIIYITACNFTCKQCNTQYKCTECDLETRYYDN